MIRRERAPAKVNLILHVGPAREDGLHAVCSLFASLDLADDVLVERAASDEVSCPGVDPPNLAADALAAFRAAARGVPLAPLRITIKKRIPVAAGLGGGSADAAAVLRAANALAGGPLSREDLRDLAATLGSDVPSQVEPAHAVVSGTGETVEPVDLPDFALVLVPQERGLSTGDVYSQLDRLRSEGVVAGRAELPSDVLGRVAAGSLAQIATAAENDLEAAALSLRPELGETLAAVRAQGALAARITGSGPTVYGVFADREAAAAAAAALDGALVVEARS